MLYSCPSVLLGGCFSMFDIVRAVEKSKLSHESRLQPYAEFHQPPPGILEEGEGDGLLQGAGIL